MPIAGRQTVTSTADDSTGERERWVTLRRKLEELRTVLTTQGSLVRIKKRGQRYWYLRYYEPTPNGRVQRSLYVGSDSNAERVRELLTQMRAPGEFLRETLRLANLARHVVRPLLRRTERIDPKE